MTDPTFLVLGAQRAGTTWLAAMLRAHPDVFVSPTKEVHFFDRKANYERGVGWYRKHFEARRTEQAIGECTPDYLWVCDGPASLPEQRRAAGQDVVDFFHHEERNYDIPDLVRRHFPELQFVVTLRNPVERAISSYLHHIRMRRLSPRMSIREVGGRHGVLGMGFYHSHLVRWFEQFPPERFLVLIYEEDIVARPREGVRRLYGHLGVDDLAPAGIETKQNERTSDPFLVAHYYAPRLARRAFRRAPLLHRAPYPRIGCTDADRRWLEELYAPENARLEGLLGRSLGVWEPASLG